MHVYLLFTNFALFVVLSIGYKNIVRTSLCLFPPGRGKVTMGLEYNNLRAVTLMMARTWRGRLLIPLPITTIHTGALMCERHH